MLLDHGVEPTSVDKKGWSSLAILLAANFGYKSSWPWLSTARVLVEAGCKVGSVEEEALQQRSSKEEIAAIQMCLRHWINEKQEERDLTIIPEEVFDRGASSVEEYLAALTTSTNPLYRHKICVVGPTTWGKTSLIKSLTRSESVLEALDTRTVGIDVFSHTFDRVGGNGKIEQHEVSFWDFAGQDLYHSAHSVFFSRRTLFLMVVDLKAYFSCLSDSTGRGSVAEEQMAKFVESKILTWLRLIFSRVPDAKLAFVGTKKDRIAPSQVGSVYGDLQMRAESWGANVAASLPLRGKRSRAMDDISQRINGRLNVALANWTVVSCMDVAAVHDLRRHLQKLLVSQRSGFLMPDSYSTVLEEVRKNRGVSDTSLQDRLRCVIVVKEEFRKRLMDAIQVLSHHDSMVDVIMRTLHDLGDVMWYDDDHCSYPALAYQGVLAPEMLIDFIREVICHELHHYPSSTASETRDVGHQRRRCAYARIANHKEWVTWMAKLRESGEMDDGLLRLLPCWSDLVSTHKEDGSEEADMWWKGLMREKTNRVLALKSLLQDFGLAYPNGKRMHSRSNLIIPAYWKLRAESATDSACTISESHLAETAGIVASDIGRYEWEYKFGAIGVPSALFEHVIVRAFHPDVTRVLATANCVVSVVRGESALEVSLACSRDRSVLRVRAVAVTRELARQCVLFACTAIEKELVMYPGLKPYRTSIVSDREKVDLDEDDDENEDVAWFRKRPWMIKDALAHYPRASSANMEGYESDNETESKDADKEDRSSPYSETPSTVADEEIRTCEELDETERSLSPESGVSNPENSTKVSECCDVSSNKDKAATMRRVQIVTCAGSFQYPVTCELVVSWADRMTTESVDILTENDWSKASLSFEGAEQCDLDISVIEAPGWFCCHPSISSGQAEILSSDSRQRIPIKLSNAKNKGIVTLECHFEETELSPRALGG
ncbi:hypothetical protein PINS_up002711 [Pythium insidiosum]|nr:hypothetical protein PINS_up002711 [Pythium insidiosum]